MVFFGAHRTLLVLVVGSKIMISSSVSLVAEKYELIASGLFLSAGLKSQLFRAGRT